MRNGGKVDRGLALDHGIVELIDGSAMFLSLYSQVHQHVTRFDTASLTTFFSEHWLFSL